jgi:uncharacterized protein YbaP (TraB family)
MVPNLFKVTSPGGEVSYLYGTQHFVTAPFEIPAEVRAAVDAARAFYIEHIIDGSEVSSMKPLSEDPRYSAETLQLIPEVLQQFCALAVLAHLSIAIKLEEGEQVQVDADLRERRESRGAEVLGLEDFRDVLRKLDANLTDERLRKGVEATQNKVKVSGILRRIEAAWKSGDGVELALIIREMREFDPTSGSAAVGRDRNLAWLPKIMEECDLGGAFFAVGAMHVYDDGNLIDLLRSRGYRVDQV